MPRTYVALDLETTGLNPERDAIIEVGAVKYRDGAPVDQFTSLVNPGRPIPYEIQQLTGIADADVLGKPRFGEVADQVRRFVGQHPVVGHNVSFDLSFLRAQDLLKENHGLDTWELATVLLPNQSGYSLNTLARQFGIELGRGHRALSDASATGQLFERLCVCAAGLPRAVLMEIARLGRGNRWLLSQVFGEALDAGGVAALPRAEVPLSELAPNSPLLQPYRQPEPLAPRQQAEQLDVASLAAMLQPGGAIGRAFTAYEYRPPQLAMMEAVARSFNQQHHLLAEAGTGTGKSLAYLLPAIAYAVKNSTRVVVSTNTINLQDQLFKKDLPDLQRILGQAWDREVPFRAALLKGRSNYLCPRRFNALRGRPNLGPEELRLIARILVWLPETQSGDQSELSLPMLADRMIWTQVSADNEGCTAERCQREMGGRCFYQRARRQAEAAHIVVINHALLMADAATENRVLPEYHHVILDEAHHLEDAVTDQLSTRADYQLLAQLLTGLHAPGSSRDGGLIADLLACLRKEVPEQMAAQIREQLVRLKQDVEEVRSRLAQFWEILQDVLNGLHPQPENGEYDTRVRIGSAIRNQSTWVEIEVSWENLGAAWHQLVRRLELLNGGLQEMVDAGFDSTALTGLAELAVGLARHLAEVHAQLEAWAIKPNHNGVYWAEVSARGGNIVLRAAPLNIGPLVQEHILYRNDTVIMTSATMRTAGSFDYLRDRLQAYDADTVAVGSPFDYEQSTLLYLPTDLPEPNAPGYQRAVEQTLVALARALDGRTLALFTSNAQLRRTAQAIHAPMLEAGITVLSQGSGASRHQLLEMFRTSSKTVLLGTRSFWEGVDVMGPALSALVLVRLPFAVPTDPVIAARSETFEDPFYNYSVPDAILRFRQGFGRLIRSKTDRGVVLVLDKRLQSKSYGQLFLDSLPECTVHRGPLMNLPSAARAWIERASPALGSAGGAGPALG